MHSTQPQLQVQRARLLSCWTYCMEQSSTSSPSNQWHWSFQAPPQNWTIRKQRWRSKAFQGISAVWIFKISNRIEQLLVTSIFNSIWNEYNYLNFRILTITNFLPI